MTNDALKMPDEIYLLHNEGDMGEHLWCENIPNDEMEFTKYIRADRAALAQAPKAIEAIINGIQQFERVVCEDCPDIHGTVISCTKDLVVVKWDDGKTGKLIWNNDVLYNAYRLQPVQKIDGQEMVCVAP